MTNHLNPETDMDLFVLNDFISSFAEDENIADKRGLTDEQFDAMVDEAAFAVAGILARFDSDVVR